MHGLLSVLEFIKPENWPPSSSDLNPVNCLVWGALQQTVYRHKISDVDRLKCVLIDCWTERSISYQKDWWWLGLSRRRESMLNFVWRLVWT